MKFEYSLDSGRHVSEPYEVPMVRWDSPRWARLLTWLLQASTYRRHTFREAWSGWVPQP